VGWVQNGHVVTTAVRPLVRPATRAMPVVSRASAKIISDRIGVSRRASLGLLAPGGSGARDDRQNTDNGLRCASVP
jgi:hypothetical protein